MAPIDDRRNRIVARLTARVSRTLQADAIEFLQEHGYPVTLAHNQVLLPLDAEGTRISDLARRASITTQAMGKLVDELSCLGLVRREVDPTDRRARLVTLTERGVEIVGMEVARLEEQHDHMTHLLGPDRYRAFVDDLSRVADTLDPGGV